MLECWSTHPLVGLPIVVHLSTTADNARALRTRAGPTAQKGRATQLPQHTVVVEAVRAGSTIECWGRVQDDLGLSVLVLGRNSLVEGAFARELSCSLNKRGRGSARRIHRNCSRTTTPCGSLAIDDAHSMLIEGWRGGVYV